MKVIRNVAVLIVIIGGIVMAAIKRSAIRKTSSRIHLHDGSAVSVSRKGILSARDARQDAILRKAVSKATSAKVINGFPVAKYDLIRKQAYWEYPDGRTEYVK